MHVLTILTVKNLQPLCVLTAPVDFVTMRAPHVAICKFIENEPCFFVQPPIFYVTISFLLCMLNVHTPHSYYLFQITSATELIIARLDLGTINIVIFRRTSFLPIQVQGMLVEESKYLVQPCQMGAGASQTATLPAHIVRNGGIVMTSVSFVQPMT